MIKKRIFLIILVVVTLILGNKCVYAEEKSDFYFTVEHFKNDEMFLENITGNGSYQDVKNGLVLYKYGYDNEAIVCVGEANEITDRCYKSILSFLEVMFGTPKATQYFQDNYPNLSQGNKEFEGIIVEVNPTKADMEERIFAENPIIRVTIDKSVVSEKINLISNNETNNDNGSVVISNNNNSNITKENTINKNNVSNINSTNTSEENIPYTGAEDYIMYGVGAALIIALIFYIRFEILNKEMK